jgi:hypothetical protein
VCSFGGNRSPATVLSPHSAVCAAPLGLVSPLEGPPPEGGYETGRVDFALYNEYGASLTDATLDFEYRSDATAAVMLRVTPSTGPLQSGSNLLLVIDTVGVRDAPGLACLVAAQSVPATWRSESQVTCLLPPGESPEAGPVMIRLTSTDGPAAGGALLFLYHPHAAPRSASPVLLAARTPASVTITGVDFVAGGGLRCRVGGGRGGEEEMPARFLSSMAVVCSLPGMHAGNVSVAVSNDGEAFSPVPAPLQVNPKP